ncbi:ammonium transporter [Butyricicoccus sp. TM10-16AC]|uniref:ammonium transporter n=1 Tax=Butyricicoccus sp. AF35-5AC TaxID=2292003 RepID=UPI000E46E80A|nr:MULTISPECIES: ammonium transporter [unclassified Butyricicoccus]RHP17513.1 ammonium transporter [Butyricicoccus sp. AF35-5AC]RHU21060.1 ammonium transporter [Butyricicoccus sp. TM10-16AC]
MELAASMDVGWTLVAAALVFFMQAGFAMVETGFTRAKNAGNIIMKNLMDFSLGTPIFWILGFGIMFGAASPFFGGFDFFADGVVGEGYDWTTLIFQTVFCATAATIVSGSMAERTKFSAYCIYSMIISAVIYPVSGHWIWGGGWLAELGFHDFAGSTAVHMVGGVAALVGAAILGPRIGKYTKDGKARAIPGHSLTLGALGCFILWFCWFGFNGGSTVALSGGGAEVASRVFVTTNMAAAVATVTVMCITWIRYKKPDVSMTLNGSLAGLVAITAGCDVVTPFGSVIIGICAGFSVVFGIEFVDQKLKVDDPVGAVGVHCINGALGTILTGLFAYYNGTEVEPLGVFYGGGFHFFGIQVLGVVAVIAWVAITMTIVFNVIKHTIGLRVSEAEEIMGLDKPEHGLSSAYADFMPVVPAVLGTKAGETAAKIKDTIPVAVEKAVPVTKVTTEGTAAAGGHKLSKIVIIAKQSKFEVLKEALASIGVSGMTVTNVVGCGVQKGAPEYYRGAEVDVTLLPKMKMEVVVSKVPVETVVETVKKVLYTGHIGDGKIFVYDVENVVKVRTGAEGFDALQDDN